MRIRKATLVLLPRAVACSVPVAIALVLVAGASHAQDGSTARSERERQRRAATAEEAPTPPPGTGVQEDHSHCLVHTREANGSHLRNRCDYPINAMYCHVRDSSRSGCQAQTISLYSGTITRASPYQFGKFRWLACRSPARPIETRRRDDTGVRVDWTCMD